jgi:K(+)-stimulated pyrophosphate-energized sodium pump
VIKLTTLFRLLAVSLAVRLSSEAGPMVSHALAALFLFVSIVFVHRSFYGMRIGGASH